MEEIYGNVDYDKSVELRPSINHTGPRSSERRAHGTVALCLGLLSVFLLVALIGLSVHYYIFARRTAAELSAIKANLTEHLKASDYVLSSMSVERDQLNVSLTETTEQLNRMQRPCPAGWMMFRCVCYLFSEKSGSWDEGRKDCRDRGANLVIIDSTEEQMFLSNFTKKETFAWIGLTDKVKENTWMWINGVPLSLKYWLNAQPDNGGGQIGEEDCAHIITGGKKTNNWNDLPCSYSLRWICEKRRY